MSNSPKVQQLHKNQDEALKDADFVYVKNWSTYTDYGRIYCNDPSWMLTEEKNAIDQTPPTAGLK